MPLRCSSIIQVKLNCYRIIELIQNTVIEMLQLVLRKQFVFIANCRLLSQDYGIFPQPTHTLMEVNMSWQFGFGLTFCDGCNL